MTAIIILLALWWAGSITLAAFAAAASFRTPSVHPNSSLTHSPTDPLAPRWHCPTPRSTLQSPRSKLSHQPHPSPTSPGRSKAEPETFVNSPSARPARRGHFSAEQPNQPRPQKDYAGSQFTATARGAGVPVGGFLFRVLSLLRSPLQAPRSKLRAPRSFCASVDRHMIRLHPV